MTTTPDTATSTTDERLDRLEQAVLALVDCSEVGRAARHRVQVVDRGDRAYAARLLDIVSQIEARPPEKETR